MAVLPVFVSRDAWVDQEWLLPGLELWLDGELAYPRDYLLPLPNRSFTGTVCKRARYSDAVGFSKALLSSLKAEDGTTPLLHPASRTRRSGGGG